MEFVENMNEHNKTKGFVIEDDGKGNKTIINYIDVSTLTNEEVGNRINMLKFHPVNNAPYILQVKECYYKNGFIVIKLPYMDMGCLRHIFDKGTLIINDDFVLYAFMQIVYAFKMHKQYKTFCKAISINDIWIDSRGKVEICWSNLALMNSKILREWININACNINVCSCNHNKYESIVNNEDSSLVYPFYKGQYKVVDTPKEEGLYTYYKNTSDTEEGNKCISQSEENIKVDEYENLRKIFIDILFKGRVPQNEMSYVIEKIKENSECDIMLESVLDFKTSDMMNEFVVLLFKKTTSFCDLEMYIKKVIQQKRLVSNPQTIFKSIEYKDRSNNDISSNDTCKTETSNVSELLISKTQSNEVVTRTTTKRGRFLIEDFFSYGENGDNTNKDIPFTTLESDVIIGPYGTREYKKGRFYVRDAAPINDKIVGYTVFEEKTKKLMRIIDAQAQQINLLYKAIINITGSNRLMEDEFKDLETLINKTINSVDEIE